MSVQVSGRTARASSRRLTAALVVLGFLTTVLTVVVSSSPPVARAAGPVCTISTKLVNSCRPWLGAESGGYGTSNFRPAMLEHEARIGRKLDIVHEYLGVGAVLTNDVVTLATRPSTIALVNWTVVNRWADGDGRSATANAQIDRMAASIKALGSTKIMLTLFHEPENNISPGGDPACPALAFSGGSGAVTDYVNMWHNVRARFDELGVNNVVWVMNYMGWQGWNCVVRSLWPGNDHVDWVMWDPYPKNATWTSFVNMFYNFLLANNDAEHDFMSKPWGLAEFGYIGSSQTAAYKIYDDARANLRNNVWPRLKAYVAWDNDTSSSHDDRVGYDENGVADPVEQQHYNAFANDPLMTGDGVPDPVDSVAPAVALTSPVADATLEGTVEVTGTATDAAGVGPVALLVDGALVGSRTAGTDGAVTFSWNSATAPNGSHTLRLRATDPSGNVGLSAPVTVSVLNTDDEAPTTPADPGVRWARPSQNVVTWSGSTDNAAVTGYRVYRDDVPLVTLGATARSHADLGVANLTGYAYRVTALDAAGNESEPTEAVSVQTGDDTAPTTPSATAELTADDEATVTWGESTDNATVSGFRVYRNGSLLGTVEAAARSLVDGGLDDAVTYSYRVAAYDESGNSSALSTAVNVRTPDLTAPSVPLDLRAVSGSQSVALTWRVATDNVAVANHVVYRDGLPLATLGGTATSFTDTAPVGTTLHRYQVLARDAAGNSSALSSEVSRTLTDTTAPTAPTRLIGSLSGFTVRLSWTAATDNVGVTGYTIYRGGVAIGTSTTPAYTDLTPPTARASSYTVRARDAAGNLGAASNAVSVSVPADVTAPTAPSSLRATVGTRQLTLAWNASADNVGVVSYYLFRGNSKYRLLGNVLTYTDTGLTTGTRYTYKVYAIDAAGNWSSPTPNVTATPR
jgi:fibronectin type 3 domain-containing protein